jgi:acyl-CoA synthetase (AMP-forming)/AMP-acid ligase II
MGVQSGIERGEARDLSHWIGLHADRSPNNIALRYDGAEITYAAFDERVRRLATTLIAEYGLQPGDRVAHLGFNGPLVLDLLFACARIGAILAPLNWRLAPAEHRMILLDCAPKVLFVDRQFRASIDGFADALANVAIVNVEDIFAPATGSDPPVAGERSQALLLVYTSGATGRPKGVVLTQEALFWNAVDSIAAHDMTSADHVLTVLPMFHVGGLNIHTTPALRAGACVTIHRRFEPAQALRAIAEDRPTLFLAVPQVSLAMTSHPDWSSTDVSSLRFVTTGSSIVPDAVMRPWLQRGVPVTQVYGLTESAPVAICLRREDAERKIGSCGKPTIHCQARIVDDSGRELPTGEKGEIVLRGPNLFREYWNDPKATAGAFADGWLRTGDIGHRDAEGFYYVDDRLKDMVIAGGENIYPAEIENVLGGCPAIREAAVVGRPDERWGEVPIAYVVAKPGTSLTCEDVMALFEGRLARFKHPREIVFLDSLPRNAMGKVLKYELRARARAAG